MALALRSLWSPQPIILSAITDIPGADADESAVSIEGARS
jgi:hypothetical protein